MRSVWETCYCVSAVEVLVCFSGPGYKAQEPRDQASHIGFPCWFLGSILCFSVSHEGYTFP